MKTIGIINGSFRNDGNTAGLTSWVVSRFDHTLKNTNDVRILVLDSTTAPLPLGPVTDATMPALVSAEDIKHGKGYASTKTQQWSQIISSLSFVLVVTPQYNHGYPGALKEAFDHLYHEWKGLPFAIFTLGGHGGGRCRAQLQQVLEEGLKMKAVSVGKVEIALPREFILGTARVRDASAEFLLDYEKVVDDACVKIIAAINPSEELDSATTISP
ncbi:flavoprotein-like protein [Lipomyces tetrasporus]|uniref:Flavoprotein-like protein n=1 Tax=Lipomyces tetrasporus TaxID=54092 RepID=A0AAD7VSX2_9ASCO|nr:flavoprotein-like protein [Lipomyces tetrasporus]KAJ8101572.1 flavoprotein-like protein [Lipomyces tetrasporus]